MFGLDYRGQVGVVMFNHAHKPFVVSVGDRIAQLILEKVSTPPGCLFLFLIFNFLF